MSSGDWMCGSCEEINFKKRDLCRRCGRPKFDNISYTSTGEAKEYSVVLAGDWYCNAVNCDAHNFASRAFCYQCNTPKYSYCDGMMGSSNYSDGINGVLPPGWKVGDWICIRPGCNEHNYACREKCHKCNTPKHYGG